MRRVLIASHGRFASGIKSSLDILLGNSDHVSAIDAYLDDSDLMTEVKKYLASVSDEDQVIMLSDLYGGSVNQVLFQLLGRPKTILISGINLALVLEVAVIKDSELTDSELENLIENSRQALVVVKNEVTDHPESTNDFFN